MGHFWDAIRVDFTQRIIYARLFLNIDTVREALVGRTAALGADAFPN